jgi:DNA-binding response OmpR family regulator
MTPETRLNGLRVLVVEDDPDSRELAVQVLSMAGARVRGVESVDELWQCFDDYCPHVVVSDISMPGVSGLDMVKELRERRAEDGGYTGVIALTAMVRREQRSEGLKLGFDRYLTKPVDTDELISTVAELGRN